MMRAAPVRIVFLRDLSERGRSFLEQRLTPLGLAEGQDRFTRPAAHILELGRSDTTRDTFAVIAQIEQEDHRVGIGVLQPYPAHHDAQSCSTVLLRGFSIDPAWQGHGIGTTATQLAIAAVPTRYPDATTLRLTVNVHNHTARHVYEHSGFRPTGEHVPGRSGREHVLTRQLTHHQH